MQTITRLDRLDSTADLSALDLREEAQGAPDAIAYRAELEGHAQRVDVLYDPASGRLGAAWGGNAEWVNCASEEAVRGAILVALGDAERA